MLAPAHTGSRNRSGAEAGERPKGNGCAHESARSLWERPGETGKNNQHNTMRDVNGAEHSRCAANQANQEALGRKQPASKRATGGFAQDMRWIGGGDPLFTSQKGLYYHDN